MTQEQLQKVMRELLEHFNDEGVFIDDNTIFSKVLSETDGFGITTNSKTVFRVLIRWTMKRNGHIDKPWPSDWISKSVETLASKII